MNYSTFNTIATQLGDGARVDVKIDGKWRRDCKLYKSVWANGKTCWLIRLPQEGSSSMVVEHCDRIWSPYPVIPVGVVQELVIHSP